MEGVTSQRRRGSRALLGALLACVLAWPAPAYAESAGAAQREADRVLAQVRALEQQVTVATAQYDAVLGSVGQAVTRNLRAVRAVDDARAEVDRQRDRLVDHVRGLYMTGGPLALYAGVLDATSVADLSRRAVVAQHLVHGDRTSLDASLLALGAAQRAAAGADQAARATIATQRDVSAAADRLTALLAEEQDALAGATARVRQLREVEAARLRLVAQRGAAAQVTAARIAQLRPLPAPASYVELYHRAAQTCPGLSWTVLAAIGQVESGHGRNTATSSAGAMGPMQFLPATFAAYGVDGNGDGVRDIHDPADAIFSAARYLCANGAGQGGATLYQAIWQYNHADWYVQSVLALARQY